MLRPLISTLCLLIAGTTARSAVVYSGLVDALIPFTANTEVYVNLYTNAVTTSLPGDYASSPWIMAFFGGSGIGNGPLVRPVVTGDVVAGKEQIANLAYGSVVDAWSRFAIGDAGFNGSETHTGAALNQFQLGTQGYIGYEFEPAAGGPSYFAVVRITIANDGSSARLHDWMYENTPGQPIVVPEPCRLFLVWLGMFSMLARRVRPA
jgi:hypothetical protein